MLCGWILQLEEYFHFPFFRQTEGGKFLASFADASVAIEQALVNRPGYASCTELLSLRIAIERDILCPLYSERELQALPIILFLVLVDILAPKGDDRRLIFLPRFLQRKLIHRT